MLFQAWQKGEIGKGTQSTLSGPTLLGIEFKGSVVTKNSEKTAEAFKSFLYKGCMKRNGISERGWEVIWLRSANLEESDNIFVLCCKDNSILNKAKEEYNSYRDTHGLSDDDHEANKV